MLFEGPGTQGSHEPVGLRLGAPFGIPITVEPGFFLFMVLIVLIRSGAGPIDIPQTGLFCFIIFFSLLAHELGHALMARMLDCDSIRISLIFFGGYATYSTTYNRRRNDGMIVRSNVPASRRFLISVAGPAVTFGLALLAFVLISIGSVQSVGPEDAMMFVLGNVLILNIIWGIFNILPVYPMDGGQALFHGLSIGMTENQAMRIVAPLSMIVCVAAGFFAIKWGYFFAAIFLAQFFFLNMRALDATR